MSTQVNLDKYNISSRLFYGLIFNKDSLPMLIDTGLVNIYLDDYGHKCRYENCILFLFNTKTKFYPSLEEKIADFQAFYDWYDVGNEGLRMLVFKIGVLYQEDFFNIKHMISKEYSYEFKKVTNLRANLIVSIDPAREIYRYNL